MVSGLNQYHALVGYKCMERPVEQVMSAPNTIEISVANFQQTIQQLTPDQLLLVEFWAPEMEACQAMSPILAKVAAEHSHALVLGRVNCAADQQLAMQCGVRSLPTVMLIKEGKMLDGFDGGADEMQIRALLDKHLPKEQDQLLAQAREHLQQQQAGDAYPLLKRAIELDSSRVDIKLALSDALLALGKLADAESLLRSIGMADQDGYYQSLMAQLELKQQAAQSPELKQLEEQHAASPDDSQVSFRLAVQYQAANRSEEALALLLSLLKKDLNAADGDAKAALLDILATLPQGDPLAGIYRRQFYSLLY
ncbi:tetratricopeptide repeat protein [Corallincola spongiicola]|uniref:Tetratricopeptide repeat protein n=1 Tax=Corallincola spongiicola TaxID=2520508 RepID=A0ABY1WL04_9GAMM|nr:tetratricopeptide repeat protein [Corallincola spongiicola]